MRPIAVVDRFTWARVILFIFTIWTVPPACAKTFSPKEISQIFSHAAKHYPTEVVEPQGSITFKQEVKNGATNYFMQNDEGGYDKNAPTFTRKTSDKGLKWLHIPKGKDRLYDWEKQTIVVMRKVPEKEGLYSALLVHFRILTGNKLVYEWDVWRPRGKLSEGGCSCLVIDKFYRYCKEWTYCIYQKNVYELSPPSDEPNEDEASTMVDRFPPGTKQSLGPFFWDLMDDEEEAGQLFSSIKDELKAKKQTYADDLDTVPFSGFNDCDYWVKPFDFEEAQQSNGPKLLLAFLAKSLRMQCIEEREQAITYDLFDAKLLYWNPKRGNVFFNTSHPFTTSINIDDTDLENLERALHIAAYSRMYALLSNGIKKEGDDLENRDAVSPTGKTIHRNTRMVVLLSIKLYEEIQTSLKQHAVKLVKRLLANLKDNLMFNIQNYVLMQKDHAKCQGKKKECAHALGEIKHDQLQILSLMYFFLFGTDPTKINDVFDDDEGADTFENWETMNKYAEFYVNFEKFLEKIANHYFQAPKPSKKK